VLQRSCSAAPGFFADPAVRLNSVVSAAASSGRNSACDADYGPALRRLVELIGQRATAH
jgi:hypothetical protein